MIITFFTKDGQFTTDNFKNIEEAKSYLADNIGQMMIEDIESTGQDRAAIFIPKATMSINGLRPVVDRKDPLEEATKEWDNPEGKSAYDLYFNSKTVSKSVDEDGVIHITHETDPDTELSKQIFKLNTVPYKEALTSTNDVERKKTMLETYIYFKNNITRLYNNPEWKEFRDMYDREMLDDEN